METINAVRVITVIGATGGIGEEVSQRLAARGARLVLGARTEAPLHALADELGADAYPLDATDYEQVQGLVDQTLETHGRPRRQRRVREEADGGGEEELPVEEYRETLALNLDTAFFTVKAAARAMMKEGGAIVLCASAVARTGLVNHEAIAAAKAGVIGLAQSAAATYAHRGVRVNCVAPGLVETPLTERITQNDAGRKQSEAMHALGRLGQPGDVASAICWLLDPVQSGWVTGQVVGVDGGLGTVRPR